jgi:hypothetical protein
MSQLNEANAILSTAEVTFAMVTKSGRKSSKKEAKSCATKPTALVRTRVPEKENDFIESTVAAAVAESGSTSPTSTHIPPVTKVTKDMVRAREEERERKKNDERIYHREGTAQRSSFDSRNIESAPPNSLPVVEDTVSFLQCSSSLL